MWLNRIWPKLSSANGDFNDSVNPAARGIPWSGGCASNYTKITTPSVSILEGDQCLVFFLGGIPGNGTLQGFSTNPTNPAMVINNPNTTKPLFEFTSARLLVRAGAAANNSATFPSFYDGYGLMPYIYFSANSRRNGYFQSNIVPNIQYIQDAGHIDPNGKARPIPFVAPFFETVTVANGTPIWSTAKFHNPETFQILCAGRDGIFVNRNAAVATYNPDFRWTPGNALSIPPDGRDDMTNFYENLMGVSQ